MITNCEQVNCSNDRTKSEGFEPHFGVQKPEKNAKERKQSKKQASKLWIVRKSKCRESNDRHRKMNDGYSYATSSSHEYKSPEQVAQDVVEAVSSYEPPPFQRQVNIHDCYLCHNLMLDPVTLPCGHTSCKKCAMASNSRSTGCEEGSALTLTCGTCAASYDPSKLKTNVVVASLIEKWWPNASKAAQLRKEGLTFVETNLDEAIAKFKIALKTDPQDHCSALDLSEALLKGGRAEESLSYAENAIKNNPKVGKNYFVKSSALISLGRYEDAVLSYLYCLHFGYNISEVRKEISKLFQKIAQQGQLCHRVSSLSFCGSGSNSGGANNPRNSSYSTTDSESGPSFIPEGFSAKMRCKMSHCLMKKESEKLRKLYDRCIQQIDIINAARYREFNVRPINWDNVDKQDLECPLCIRLMFEPVTTPCGHMYCRRCLDRSLDHQILCPLCKTSLEEYLAERRQRITQIVELTIQNFLPNEAAERKKADDEELISIKKAGTISMQDVPLFICTIAFPTVPCPLHIFEPRYRLMTRQCVESGSRMFGMCPTLPHDETRTTYGTMLQIRDMQFLPDGRSILETMGRRRFKVLDISMRDGYHTGTIEYIEDEPIEGGEEVIRELKKLQESVYQMSEEWFGKLTEETKYRIIQHFGPKPSLPEDILSNEEDGPAWLWWLVAVLPLDTHYQLTFLGHTSYRKRLELAYRLLEYCISNPEYS